MGEPQVLQNSRRTGEPLVVSLSSKTDSSPSMVIADGDTIKLTE
jgi:hypothetical protein